MDVLNIGVIIRILQGIVRSIEENVAMIMLLFPESAFWYRPHDLKTPVYNGNSFLSLDLQYGMKIHFYLPTSLMEKKYLMPLPFRLADLGSDLFTWSPYVSLRPFIGVYYLLVYTEKLGPCYEMSKFWECNGQYGDCTVVPYRWTFASNFQGCECVSACSVM